MSLPLFVRENTILPVGENDTQAVYDYEKNVTLRIYALKDEAQCAVRTNTGDVAFSAHAKNADGHVVIRFNGAHEGANVLLVNVHAVKSLVGASAQDTPEGLLLTAVSDTVTCDL